MALREEIGEALNRASAENGSNTPDHVLAAYLVDCLAAFDRATTQRDNWYGISPHPVEGVRRGEEESGERA